MKLLLALLEYLGLEAHATSNGGQKYDPVDEGLNDRHSFKESEYRVREKT